MTAIQILEKLGGDASFSPISMSEDEMKSVDQVLQNDESMPILSHHAPDTPEDEDEDDEKDPEDK